MAEQRNEEEATQATRTKHLRWMLIVSTAAAVIAMIAVAIGFAG